MENKKDFIAVIIPCYNEFNRLNTKEFSSFLSKEKNQHISFLFVNDGSQDNTIDLLRELASKFEKVSFINLEENVGKAEAIRQGVLHSKSQQFDYIGYFDADLAAPLDEITIAPGGGTLCLVCLASSGILPLLSVTCSSLILPNCSIVKYALSL